MTRARLSAVTHALAVLTVIAATPLGAACHAPPPASSLDTPTLRDAGLATCSAAKDPLHPLIVEWPTASRADLEAAAQRGPVIVSYAGCSLRVLRRCTVRDPAHYELAPTTPAEQRFELATSADLYAHVPLAAVSLEAKLAQSGGFSLTYVAVGERVLAGSGSPTLLDGDCEGASHYVDAMVLGAFDLAARAARHESAGVHAGGAALGTEADAERARGASGGDVALCKARGLAAGASCEAVLSLGLHPLRVVGKVLGDPKPGSSPRGALPQPDLAVIPALGGLQSLHAAGARGKVDVGSLELLENARKLDGDATSSSRAKANAWNALASVGGSGDATYRAVAERRRDDWLKIAKAQEESHARLLERCLAYEADKRKLGRVLALGDEVVAAADKTRFQQAFDATYGPWKSELDRCSVPRKPVDGMVTIPAGTFVMGVASSPVRGINYSDPRDAGPPHRVALPEFAIDVTEVSVGAYRRCVAAHECSVPLAPASTHYHCTWSSGKDNLPINCVDREQARAYCEWADKRLPTEEEWEYAAHPFGGAPWPWALPTESPAELSRHACWKDDGLTCPVGSMPGASLYGVRDMAGNVWEWTDSFYTSDYTRRHTSKLAVIRGGAYSSPVQEMLEVTYRGSMDPARRVPWVGFRCAR